jgi:hypothetical protein
VYGYFYNRDQDLTQQFDVLINEEGCGAEVSPNWIQSNFGNGTFKLDHGDKLAPFFTNCMQRLTLRSGMFWDSQRGREPMILTAEAQRTATERRFGLDQSVHLSSAALRSQDLSDAGFDGGGFDSGGIDDYSNGGDSYELNQLDQGESEKDEVEPTFREAAACAARVVSLSGRHAVAVAEAVTAAIAASVATVSGTVKEASIRNTTSQVDIAATIVAAVDLAVKRLNSAVTTSVTEVATSYSARNNRVLGINSGTTSHRLCNSRANACSENQVDNRFNDHTTPHDARAYSCADPRVDPYTEDQVNGATWSEARNDYHTDSPTDSRDTLSWISLVCPEMSAVQENLICEVIEKKEQYDNLQPHFAALCGVRNDEQKYRVCFWVLTQLCGELGTENGQRFPQATVNDTDEGNLFLTSGVTRQIAGVPLDHQKSPLKRDYYTDLHPLLVELCNGCINIRQYFLSSWVIKQLHAEMVADHSRTCGPAGATTGLSTFPEIDNAHKSMRKRPGFSPGKDKRSRRRR